MVKSDLPPEVRTRVEQLVDAVRAASAAPDAEIEALLAATDRSLATLMRAVRPGDDANDHVTDFATLIGRRTALYRAQAGWSQARLAEAMERLGFPWRRITVAEVEGAKRRVALEELLALAALFGIPMVFFLLPEPQDRIAFPGGRALDPADVLSLIIGIATRGGSDDWEPARHVAAVGPGASDWRPAPDLHSGAATRRLLESFQRGEEEA